MRARMLHDATHWPTYDACTVDPIDTDHAKLRDEFLSWPALCLTVEQVARLLHVPVVAAVRLLAGLEHDGFLIRTPSGAYRLAEPAVS